MNKHIKSALLIALLSVVTLEAHPGHSLYQASPAHLCSSPDHLIVLALAGAALLLAACFVRRTWRRRVMKSVAVAAIVLSVVLCGLCG